LILKPEQLKQKKEKRHVPAVEVVDIAALSFSDYEFI
jgi:hypothetical protein